MKNNTDRKNENVSWILETSNNLSIKRLSAQKRYINTFFLNVAINLNYGRDKDKNFEGLEDRQFLSETIIRSFLKLVD